MKKVFVVILNFNGVENTIECLESVFKTENNKGFLYEVIVVDNASRDGSVEKIRNKFKNVILIENQKNLGFTGGCNEGIRYALKSGADYIMLLNNDTRLDDRMIDHPISSAVMYL